MRNILYEGYLGPRLPREVQLQRIQRVIQEELTQLQREAIIAYYFQQMNIPQIAAQRGVNKSTVSRTLRRAEEKNPPLFAVLTHKKTQNNRYPSMRDRLAGNVPDGFITKTRFMFFLTRWLRPYGLLLVCLRSKYSADRFINTVICLF